MLSEIKPRMKALKIFPCLVLFALLSNGQQPYSGKLAHTFSIIARDSVTGQMGVAVQSHWFSVGSIVGWAEAGVGVVATQSFVNPSYGPEGLKFLREGKSPQVIIAMLTDADSAKDVRQLAVMDANGNTAAFTGKKCIPEAGHISEKNFSVQANLMMNDNVWPAMAAAFRQTAGPLPERMIAALEAAQAAGGDIRGKQSASLLIVDSSSSGRIWEDRKIDLRVEDDAEPIRELKRLLKLHRAYEHMNAGDLALEKNDFATAMKEYETAETMFSKNAEFKFWHAVTLVNKDKIEKALPLFKKVFMIDSNWALLIPRLRKVGLLNCDVYMEDLILYQLKRLDKQ